MFLVHTVGFNARRQVAQARSSDAQSGRRPRKAALQKPALVLAAILAGFLLLESLLPLSTAIKIGADDDWQEVVTALLHEALEYVFSVEKFSYKPMSNVTSTGDQYLFVLTHPQFSAACGRVRKNSGSMTTIRGW